MYKALNYWVFGGMNGEKSPEEFIEFAARKQLDGVELTVGDAIDINISETECRKISSRAAAAGVALRTLATGFYWGCSLGLEAECREAQQFTRRYLQIAAWLGVETILVIPGATRVMWDPSRPVASYRSVWDISVRSLRELLPVAEKYGVNIALENVWNRFLLSPMEWKYYLEQFDSERIGIYFDVGNCCIFGNPPDYVEILAGKIKAIHIKNFHGDDCGGNLHGFGENLEQGDVDFTTLKHALHTVGYQGPVTVEMIPFCRLPDLKLPDQELAERTVEQFKRVF